MPDKKPVYIRLDPLKAEKLKNSLLKGLSPKSKEIFGKKQILAHFLQI